jgi:hypothetical protein
MIFALIAALSSLAPFVGEWKCTETMVDKTQMHSRMSVQPAFDGAWLEIRYENDAAKPVRGVEYWGWDGKRFVELGLNNQGARESGVSDGWKDGKLVWSGSLIADGKPTALRASFTARGNTLANHVEIGDNGKWTALADVSCAK